MRSWALRLSSIGFATALSVSACGTRLDSGGPGGAGGTPAHGGEGSSRGGISGDDTIGASGDGSVGTSGASGVTDGPAASNAGSAGAALPGTSGAGGAEAPTTALCGDGALDIGEACDDGGDVDGDGCSASCMLEAGFGCTGAPSICSRTSCGNRIREGTEACDDGNNVPFDGCDANCRAEPTCTGDGCRSTCGDGLLLGEECDDGNTRGGDGCSATCKVEPGFACSQPKECEQIAGTCVLRLPVIYRDLTDKHPDIEPSCLGAGVMAGTAATPGLVNKILTNGVPTAIAKSTTGTEANGCITSLDTWYSDSGSKPIVREIVLFDNGNGTFVNRHGEQGQQWESQPKYKDGRFCGNGDTHCQASVEFSGCAFDASVDSCLYPCPPSIGTPNNTCAGAISVPATKFDGAPFFFPLDDQLKNESWFDAQVPPEYGYQWEYEDQVVPVYGAAHVQGQVSHNFHFTTQAAYWFKYDAAVTTKLDFTGDDDLWLFVNGKLALDLGGLHAAVSGSLSISASTAANFALQDGSVYRIDIFHAERKKYSSSLRLSLSRLDLSRTVCTRL